ncbi:putative phosphoesterase [Methanocella paludicola SANAE]|uniref:Phosphoesterase n=1 Tax=Methanocella paludicola (strain DSM 17711 / JCM 13418 / NBRC 101707 / SANAE) TaxID=304371 RepID=D1YWT1_METPS|nr:metallophosphoesterase [Methanocella paludicola]BAI60903.1 putative phosphoesterase [Methanocella paludicola SANAE]
MKIAVLSDTHLRAKMPQELLDMLKDADLVVHAGDFITPVVYEAVKASSKRLVAVHGNSDDDSIKSTLPESVIFDAEGVKIGVIHKGRYGTDVTNMRYLALEMGVKVLIYGHLHSPVIDQTDVLLLCPGSPIFPRMADPTIAILHVEGSEIRVDIIKTNTGQMCKSIDFARSLGKE